MWWGSRQQQQCHQARWSGRAPRWRMSGRHSACEVSGWNNLSRTGNLHKQACRENALDPGLSTAVMLDYLMYSLLSIKSPNNKLINKMDHELMDVQDYSWEPLRWLCIFTSCVMEGLEESVMMQFDWTSLPYWWFNQIRPPLQNNLYAKLILFLSSSTGPERRHQDDILQSAVMCLAFLWHHCQQP